MDTVTLFEHARQKVGIREASKALAFMVQWGIARDSIGHEPQMTEYAEYWRVSERSAYREKAVFARAFPGETSPSRILDLAERQIDARSASLVGLGTVQLA